MKRKIYIILFLINNVYVAQQNVDSLYNIWEDSSLKVSVRAKALNNVFKQISRNYPDSCFKVAQLQVEFSLKNGLDTSLYSAYENLGFASKILEKPKLAIESYFQSLKIANKLKDTMLLIASESNIASTFTYFQQHQKALYYFDKVIALCEKKDYQKKLSINYHNKGKTLMFLENYDSALVYLRKGLKIFRKIDHKIGVAITEVNMAIINITLVAPPLYITPND